jgi:hypothetical protein
MEAAQLRQSANLDGRGQSIAVIDSGVAWDHVALGGGIGPGYRVVGGWDFAEDDDNPYDDGPAGFHGTHVAGILAGSSDRYQGIAPGADIVALRVFDDQGVGKLPWIESALRWVYDHRNSLDSPITTVNLSVGAALNVENGTLATTMLEDELQLLREAGILIFAAAGNGFENQSNTAEPLLYPASSSHVVAVGSLTESGELSSFSQRAPGILAARGESISSAVPDHVFGWDGQVDDFVSLSGTSMATPNVAAASMLVRQAYHDAGMNPSADEILQRLEETSDERIDASTGQKYRVLNLIAATSIAEQGSTDTPALDHYRGDSLEESIRLDLSSGVSLQVNEIRYDVQKSPSATPFLIDAAEGADSLVIIGSPDAERLILRTVDSGESSWLTTQYGEFELRGFERVEFRGGGGPDRATIYDSFGSDTLTSNSSHTMLSGVGFQFDVFDVTRIYAHATAGGSDTAFLHDSANNDMLSVRPQFTSLRSGHGFQLAYGFERVYAYADAGGIDSAELYDSNADDTMNISSDRAIISAENYVVSTRGFLSVVAIASSGGNDLVRIYADSGANQWHRTDDLLQWSGQEGNLRMARGFERAQAFESYEEVQLLTVATPSWLKVTTDKESMSHISEADASRIVFSRLSL